jgi:predicted nucleic acid-binding protein
MHVVLDTNTLIRFLTNDQPQKAEMVKELLQREKSVEIPESVFPEISYILSGKYGVSREEVGQAYALIREIPSVKLTTEVNQAIDIFQSSKLDMVDCLVAAHAKAGKLATFDNQLRKLASVMSYW